MFDLTPYSKFLSLLLRHNPASLNLTMDSNGWVEVQQIIDNSKGHKQQFTMAIIEHVVENNNKKRFAFSPDKTKIRANQGHSVGVDVELEEKIPPVTLYHGTSKNTVDVILKTGIQKMKRTHVHLSVDEATAINVGGRHGSPVVLEIDTRDMVKDGIKFYISKNNVWLTDSVPPQYLKMQF